MLGGKFTVEAVGQSAQFLAGVSAWPVDRLFVRVERAQTFGAVVEVERQRRQLGEGADFGYRQAAGDAAGGDVPGRAAREDVVAVASAGLRRERGAARSARGPAIGVSTIEQQALPAVQSW